jgi:hypothetical protein
MHRKNWRFGFLLLKFQQCSLLGPLRLGKMANGKNFDEGQEEQIHETADSTNIQVQISMFSLNLEMKKNMTEAGGSKLRPRFASPVTTAAFSNYQSGLSHFI